MGHQIELRHDGLKRSRVVRGSNRQDVERRAEAQRLAWEAAWRRVCARAEERQRRERAAPDQAAKLALAQQLTAEAESLLTSLEQTLAHGLACAGPLDFEALKHTGDFPTPTPRPPEQPVYPPRPDRSTIPPRPQPAEPEYSLADALLFQKDKKRRAAESAYRIELEAWKELVHDFNEKVARYTQKCAEIKKLNREVAATHRARVQQWDAARAGFLAEQQAHNNRIDTLRAAYLRRDPEALVAYYERVLDRSEYPEPLGPAFDLDYRPETRTLVVDAALPGLDQMPTIRGVRYNEPWDIFEETELPEADRAALYDRLIDQIALRTLHELVAADALGAVAAVIWRGWIEATDPATGQPTRPCVLSLHAERPAFEALDLARVNPRECVRGLGALGEPPYAALHHVTPHP